MAADLPSFDKAEFLPSAQGGAATDVGGAADRCVRCERRLEGTYYRVEERPMCEGCAEEAAGNGAAGSHAAFVRALLFGAGAAVLGLILYATVEIATGWVIGYVAIAVGYLVGKGMKWGSRGRGGRRYQIAAAVLTYLAVSMAAIPVGIHAAMKSHGSGHTATGVPRSGESAPSQASGSGDAGEPATGAGGFSGTHPLVWLLGLGIASPFVELSGGVSGVIGLFILFIGIRAAWQLTGGSESLVTGPYRVSTSAEGLAST